MHARVVGHEMIGARDDVPLVGATGTASRKKALDCLVDRVGVVVAGKHQRSSVAQHQLRRVVAPLVHLGPTAPLLGEGIENDRVAGAQATAASDSASRVED